MINKSFCVRQVNTSNFSNLKLLYTRRSILIQRDEDTIYTNLEERPRLEMPDYKTGQDRTKGQSLRKKTQTHDTASNARKRGPCHIIMYISSLSSHGLTCVSAPGRPPGYEGWKDPRPKLFKLSSRLKDLIRLLSYFLILLVLLFPVQDSRLWLPVRLPICAAIFIQYLYVENFVEKQKRERSDQDDSLTHP